MPTYEYECQQCGHRFEEFQSITAEPCQTCPEASCKGPVKRLIGMGGGLLFKGTGFYTTDYRSDGYQKAAKADKGQRQQQGRPTKKAIAKRMSPKPIEELLPHDASVKLRRCGRGYY